MKATKILENETQSLRVSSLPTRPTAPINFGGLGYTSTKLKESFDRLPLFIVERFNTLLDDIADIGEDSLAAAINTAVREGHTLSNLFSDITNGNFAAYLSVGEKTLATELCEIHERLSALEAKNE